MPQPYSYDLRLKAIAAYHSGKKKIEISRYFNLSRNTLDLWLKRAEKTGDIKANKPGPKLSNAKIQDLEKFSLFVAKNNDKTPKEIGELWGDNVTQQNVSYACKKLGITRKKKTFGYQERDEEKRKEFVQKLEKIAKKKIVYVDEAGFDNREDYHRWI